MSRLWVVETNVLVAAVLRTAHMVLKTADSWFRKATPASRTT